MPIRLPHATAVALFSLALVGTAQAGPYVAGHLARTTTKYDDVKVGTGFSLAAGYSFNQLELPLFFEGSYYDSGKLKIEDSGGLRLEYDGLQGYAGIAAKLGPSGSMAWIKGGYYKLDGMISNGGGSASEKSNGLTLGLGGDWMFSPQVGARFEIETPFKVKSIPGLGSDEKTQLSIIKVGLVWRPSLGDGTGDRAAAPESTPVAESPKTEMAAPFGIGASAKVSAGAVLRAQPKTEARAMTTVKAETTVQLAGSATNTSGAWWYVKGSGLAGWVLVSDLTAP